jgi:transposase InsO family protein
MQQAGTRAVTRRRHRHTRDARYYYPAAPNVLSGDFRAERENRAWLTNISYIPKEEGWLDLGVVPDLHSHRAVGWSMPSRLYRGLVIDELSMALGRRRSGPGLIHHSGRGGSMSAASSGGY